MITNLNTSCAIAAFCGLSTDDKPINVSNGSTFYEIDTSKEYMFDAQGKTWYEQASEGGSGGGDTSELFVVNVALDEATGVYTADKTLNQALAAADSGKLIVIHSLYWGYYNFATHWGDLIIIWDEYNMDDPTRLRVNHFTWMETLHDGETIDHVYSEFPADSK